MHYKSVMFPLVKLTDAKAISCLRYSVNGIPQQLNVRVETVFNVPFLVVHYPCFGF